MTCRLCVNRLNPITMTDVADNSNAGKKRSKITHLKPQLPRGLRDLSGADWQREHDICETLAVFYRTYGFAPLSTPSFEYADVLGSFLPDAERPNAGVFALEDDDGKWLSLRYDLTAPLARHVAAHYEALPKPCRRYQFGSVYRNEKPGAGRYRQFVQMDADIVGVAHVYADAEMCLMAHDAMLKLGFRTSDFRIRYSTRKLIDSLMDGLGIDTATQKLTVLRAIDKRDRLGMDAVRALLGAGRRDSSGDFTAGAGLDAAGIEQVSTFLAHDDFSTSTETVAGLSRADVTAAHEELSTMATYFEAHDVASDTIGFDSSIVRGLGYYTGPVFEIDLLGAARDAQNAEIEDAMLTRIGAVGGGGRYDNLISRFRGGAIPATGISIGVSRLAIALATIGREIAPSPPLIMVAVMDSVHILEHALLVRTLRNAGYDAELYMGKGGLRAQLRYADARGVRLVLIEGDDERAKQEITVKDMALGTEKSAEISDNVTWRRGDQMQQTISKSDLLSKMRDILA